MYDDTNIPPAPTLSPGDQKLINRIEECVSRGRSGRTQYDDRWSEGLDYYNGEQWRRRDAGRTVDLKNPKVPSRLYTTDNQVRTVCRRHISRALARKRSVTIKPLTSRETDRAASMQARSLINHWEYLWDFEDFFQKCLEHATIVGPVFALPYWDTGAVVPLPQLDEQGEIIQVVDAPAGEMAVEMVSCFSVYPDNDGANGWDQITRLVIERQRPLSWIKARWPEMGQYVKRESGSGVAAQINYVSGQAQREVGSSQDSAMVRTYIDLPAGDYPGCVAITCQSVILEKSEQWPWPQLRGPDGRPCMPLIPLEFEAGILSLWGDNVVTPLKPLQRFWNRCLSHMERRTANGDGKLLSPRGAQLDSEAFRSGIENEIVYWTPDPLLGGAMPTFLPTPALDPVYQQLIPIIQARFNTQAEVGDASTGKIPPGQISARLMEALREADESAGVLFDGRVRRFIREIWRRSLAIAKGKIIEPRLVMLQDATEDQPMMTAQTFDEFSQGRFEVDVQFSQNRSPASQAETLMEMGKAGMFSPEQIPTTLLLLKVLNIAESDELADDLVAALKAILAQEAEQAQAQEEQTQQQEQMDAQREQTLSQRRGEEIASETDAKIALEQARHEMMQQTYAKNAAMDVLKHSSTAAIDAKYAMETEDKD